jgi:methylmalonyl-CoA mutase C-terminal domain/subunit
MCCHPQIHFGPRIHFELLWRSQDLTVTIAVPRWSPARLRDAGMEVIYTGLHQTPDQIVATALAEDADAIGLSVLSGAHMTLFAKVIELLRKADAEDIVVFGGGIIPEADRQALAEMGVAQIFTPGATMSDIVSWVRANVGLARRVDAG